MKEGGGGNGEDDPLRSGCKFLEDRLARETRPLDGVSVKVNAVEVIRREKRRELINNSAGEKKVTMFRNIKYDQTEGRIRKKNVYVIGKRIERKSF